MLYFNFKNYEEFKCVFGTRVANNGKKVRSNHILLSFLKHEFKCKRFHNLYHSSIVTMVNSIMNEVMSHDSSQVLIDGTWVYSSDYYIDHKRGLCDDGDAKCVRYVRRDNDRAFKMKAGKFYRHVLQSCGLTEKYCEQAIIYVCEAFAEYWQSHIKTNYGDGLTLHVDYNFSDIYDSDYLQGDFNSCMVDDGRWTFYRNSVKAKAAYLTNDDDMIVSRCIIFTEVHDKETGEVLRLAERQYSTDGDNTLKQILVNKLIQGGHIDGYKRVGVDCHKARKFVSNDGEDWSEKRFYIECSLDYDDTISYQDSFKYFDYDNQRADNYGYGSIDLATTDGELRRGDEYDEYHGEYCEEVFTLYVWNEHCDRYGEVTCNVNDRDEFYLYNGEYYDELEHSSYDGCDYPKNEVVWSDFHDSYLHEDDAAWCEEAEDYFSDYNYHEDFDQWKQDNWEYDEFNNEYVKKTTTCYVWNDSTEEYDVKHVEITCAEEDFFLYEGEWYDQVNDEGIPFTMVEELEECESI